MSPQQHTPTFVPVFAHTPVGVAVLPFLQCRYTFVTLLLHCSRKHR
jgi:hypothetical protein